jgi:glycosyltransferase involved in cell wall biosynthesis
MWSVIIPTYNRLPILQKCLMAMEQQNFDLDYEILVIDDGSTDDTIAWINAQLKSNHLSYVRLLQQNHQGAAAARNLGIERALGEIVVFIDSDLVEAFTYGLVINTANFEEPTITKFKLTDISNAFFATGNVAIARHWLIEAGMFDLQFKQYGWEDLELGVRLKNLGLKLIKCPKAIGYHWHPAFNLAQLPHLIDQEQQRGRMGVIFYKKHPTWEVKMMIQMTWIHRLLWGTLSLGGFINERSLQPLLSWLINQGKPQLALEIARIFLNWYNVQSVYAAYYQDKLENY